VVTSENIVKLPPCRFRPWSPAAAWDRFM